METERILLRPWRESDAGSLFKYASDPEVGPRAGWPPHKSVEESLEIIRTIFSAEGMWAVIWKEAGEAIGCVGYLPASSSNLQIADDECEVGYWIARPFWGKGICTEALKLIIGYCFNERGFTTLWGSYFPSNPASGRVMEKCGFVDTGVEVMCPNLEIGSDLPVRVMKKNSSNMSRKETVIAAILLVIIGTSMHFVHHLPCFNHFWGYIFPVKESVMAHAKMIIYPMALLSLYLIISRKDIREVGAPILAGLAVIPLIIVAFFSYWVFVRHELMALDIVIYIASIIGAILLTGRWRTSSFVRKYWPLWTVLFLITVILTGYLTYNAPEWIVFADLG